MSPTTSALRTHAARLPDIDDRPAATRGLIEAKLLIPRRRSATVNRTRLLRRVRSAGHRRVVSIVAPPGYGKTSFLVQLATQDPRATAWLTADDGDNDPVVFLTYLAAAIDRIEPLDPDLFGAIASPAVSNRAVVGRLLAVLSGRAEPILIVIDDAHRIADRDCLDALAELVTYLPAGSQLAVAGRDAIALPIARWRVDGSMLELGPNELAMDEREAAGLSRRLGVVLSAEAATAMTRRTGGWPALLALLAWEARRSDGEVSINVGRDRLVADYLRSELLDGRPEEDVVFLTRTSILEQLSGPVCDVVAERFGSAERLETLARSTLLVDEYGGSYRYHTLLRDFLQSELAAREPEQVARSHRRAAAWYEANRATELAVDHALAAGDLDLAATFMGSAMASYHWSGRRATNRAWYGRFGDEALLARPWLAVLAAWEELAVGDLDATVRLADIAEAGTFEGLPPDGTASFESGRAMLRAGLARSGADDALANATRAVELESEGSRWRAFAVWELAIARRTHGDREGADAALDEAIAMASANGNLGLGHCLAGHRALLAVDRADWDAAIRYAVASDEMGGPANLEGYVSSAPARAARARIAIHRGDIAGARAGLAQAVNLRPVLTAACPALNVESLLAFARAHLAVGDPAGARTLIAQARGVIRRRPDLGVFPDEVEALGATLAATPASVTVGASTLTAAELRVLALLPYYLSFKEIGQRLGVKATTVKTHALALYGKLGASTRGEAIDLAVEAGLLERFAPGPAVSAIEEDAVRRSR